MFCQHQSRGLNELRVPVARLMRRVQTPPHAHTRQHAHMQAKKRAKKDKGKGKDGKKYKEYAWG